MQGFPKPRVIPIVEGGTGATSTTGSLNNLLPSQSGHSGKALVTNGSTASWQTIAGLGETNDGANVGTGAEVFKDKSGVNLRFRSLLGGTGVTVTEGTDDITLTINQSSLTLGNLGGTLGPTKGGTGLTSATLGDVIYASAANTWSKLAGNTALTLAVLTQTGTGTISAAPVWTSAASLPVGSHTHVGSDIISGTVAQNVGGTGITSYTPGNILYANAGGTLTKLAPGSAGHVLTMVGGFPSWQAAGAGVGTVTSIDVQGGTTGLAPTGGPVTSSGVITLAGTLVASHGGTGQTTYIAGDMLYSIGVGTLAKLAIGADGEVLTALGGVPVWTTVTGTGTVTDVDIDPDTTGLTFTGGPVTTTGVFTVGGTLEEIHGGTGTSTYTTGDILYASGANTLAKLAAGANGDVLTLAGGVPTWDTVGGGTVTSVDGSGGTTGLTFSGGPIVGAGTLTLGGTLDETHGGTGLSTFTTGDIMYASSANTLAKLAAGTNGHVLTLAGGVPSWAAASSGTPNFYADDGTTPTDALTASGLDSLALGNGAIATATRAMSFGKSRAASQDSAAGFITDNTTSYGVRGAGALHALAFGYFNQVNNSSGNNGKWGTIFGGNSCTLTQEGGSIFGATAASVLASGANMGSCIVGGWGLVASGHRGFGGGGTSNVIDATCTEGAIIGGNTNAVYGDLSAIAGGLFLKTYGYGQFAVGQYNHMLPTSISSTYTATDPVQIWGNGTANGASTRSNAAYLTFNSIFNLGGKETGGANGSTGVVQLGFTAETTRVKITTSTHAADRTLTLRDTGANADIVLSTHDQFSLVAKTANYTATAADVRITADTTGGAFQITLPDAAGIAGTTYRVKKIDVSANNLTVVGTGGDTIDGAASKVWNAQWESHTFTSDGANWLLDF